ncbi:MAG: hypothetical protein HXX09_16210, partial [Bacteroidetes bacterium]|nr:hypothetical protein [Bacteroidota bacterium]
DTIDGNLLIKFKNEINGNSTIEDRIINQGIWQMETYFNIKYGLKDGINNKFGGDICGTSEYSFTVPIYVKGGNTIVKGKELISGYKNASAFLRNEISSKGKGLVLADVSVKQMTETTVTFTFSAIHGEPTQDGKILSPKRVLRDDQSLALPSNFAQQYPLPFSYGAATNGGNNGFNKIFNPNQYWFITEGPLIPIWSNVVNANLWFNHHSNAGTNPWVSGIGWHMCYSGNWGSNVTLTPQKQFDLIRTNMITIDYYGLGETVMLFWVWSNWIYPEEYYDFSYKTAIKSYIPNPIFSDL